MIIMKEHFPSLAKEIDFQEVQEAQRVLKILDPRMHIARHIIITLAKIKDKKRKGLSYLQRSSHQSVSWFLKRNLAGKKGLERSIPSQETQRPTSKTTLSFRMEEQIKCFQDKVKLKEFIIIRPLLYEMLKELI